MSKKRLKRKQVEEIPTSEDEQEILGFQSDGEITPKTIKKRNKRKKSKVILKKSSPNSNETGEPTDSNAELIEAVEKTMELIYENQKKLDDMDVTNLINDQLTDYKRVAVRKVFSHNKLNNIEESICQQLAEDNI